MNSAAAAPSRVRPRRRVFFRLSVGTWAVRRSSARGANANPCGANPFARAPCREAFAVGSAPARGKSFRSCAVSGGLRRGEPSRVGQILSPVRRVGRPSPWGAFSRGQILSPVRRVGRPSPWGAFLRGANSFARAPCREAFAEGRVPARGKSFRLRAVSGGLRRGERSRAG